MARACAGTPPRRDVSVFVRCEHLARQGRNQDLSTLALRASQTFVYAGLTGRVISVIIIARLEHRFFPPSTVRFEVEWDEDHRSADQAGSASVGVKEKAQQEGFGEIQATERSHFGGLKVAFSK